MTDPVALRERARELREYGEHSRDPRIIRETREDAAEVELWADEVEAEALRARAFTAPPRGSGGVLRGAWDTRRHPS